MQHVSLEFAVWPNFSESNQTVTLSYFCMSDNYRQKMESEVMQEPLIYTSYEETGLLMNSLEEVK